jgi:hypothetical protein
MNGEKIVGTHNHIERERDGINYRTKSFPFDRLMENIDMCFQCTSPKRTYMHPQFHYGVHSGE